MKILRRYLRLLKVEFIAICYEFEMNHLKDAIGILVAGTRALLGVCHFRNLLKLKDGGKSINWHKHIRWA